MTTADQVAPLDPAARAAACAVGLPADRRDRGRRRASFRHRHLPGSRRPDPDRAGARGRASRSCSAMSPPGLLLLAIIGREVWLVVRARRRGYAGSRLHVQIVGLFAVIAAVPTILVAVVASTTLDRGLDRFFSTRTRAMIEQSLIVADAYVQRARPVDPRRDHGHGVRSRPRQADVRSGPRPVPEILHRAGHRARPLGRHDDPRRRLDRSSAPTSRWTRRSCCRRRSCSARSPRPSRRSRSSPKAITSPPPSSCTATTTSTFMSRACSIRAWSQQLRATQESVGEYANLEARRLGIQIAFALMFAVIALIVLLSSAWIGLDFANRLVAPIRRLIGAANVVSTGNLHVQVPIRRSEGDLAQLGETFNKMTQELRTQHDDIVRARDVIDSRRRFTEAVLAGASAGVIGVNAEGPHHHPQPLGRAAPGAHRKRGARPSARRGRARTRRDFSSGAQRQSAPGSAPGDRQPQRPGAELLGARDQRAGRRIRARLCHHHRRHHRTGAGAAHLGLGRHRAAHRARDQEPADADPVVGRTAAPQIRQGDRRGRCRVRAMHRRPSCARSTTSSAWSTNSRALRACRRRSSPPRTSPTPCVRSCS